MIASVLLSVAGVLWSCHVARVSGLCNDEPHSEATGSYHCSIPSDSADNSKDSLLKIDEIVNTSGAASIGRDLSTGKISQVYDSSNNSMTKSFAAMNSPPLEVACIVHEMGGISDSDDELRDFLSDRKLHSTLVINR